MCVCILQVQLRELEKVSGDGYLPEDFFQLEDHNRLACKSMPMVVDALFEVSAFGTEEVYDGMLANGVWGWQAQH